jgi:hypothetical protein
VVVQSREREGRRGESGEWEREQVHCETASERAGRL